MRYLLLSMTLLMTYPHMSVAEENTSPPIPLSGGIICDTLDDVIAVIERQPAETCGRLVIPAVGTVTPVVEYEAHGMKFYLVRFDFMNPRGFAPIQYGWFGKPQPIPASLGAPA